jgi:hypothetical protein
MLCIRCNHSLIERKLQPTKDVILGELILVKDLNPENVTTCVTNVEPKLLVPHRVQRLQLHRGFGESTKPVGTLPLVAADNLQGAEWVALLSENG